MIVYPEGPNMRARYAESSRSIVTQEGRTPRALAVSTTCLASSMPYSSG